MIKLQLLIDLSKIKSHYFMILEGIYSKGSLCIINTVRVFQLPFQILENAIFINYNNKNIKSMILITTIMKIKCPTILCTPTLSLTTSNSNCLSKKCSSTLVV